MQLLFAKLEQDKMMFTLDVTRNGDSTAGRWQTQTGQHTLHTLLKTTQLGRREAI
jgi:putative heme degradation protein